ncbi:hypothetical protein E7744_04245 [Citricoccus sp. SGAir0253]|uniref:hypothetical protein n=1 Tax=Citricoccus sp. SGAir0253 TaxID=2567881 RepID=UPI0010CD387F|nr:hypothetical protein [Citricoccus sp. SGAir0253]QCU77516.1 hypothetical protein E7744_04245 [Citricoccus sp. SGAir0253]
MYAWIFRHLPGPLWLRVLESLVLLGLVLVALVTVVFPWASPFFPWTASTVEAVTVPVPAWPWGGGAGSGPLGG